MHRTQGARAAGAAPSLHGTPFCTRRLTAAVLDWRARLENGEDCGTLQAEILCFARGDRDVLRALIEIAQTYEQPGSSPMVGAGPDAGRRRHLRPVRG
jgi:hypothetical protein